jgi:hypothetical protein
MHGLLRFDELWMVFDPKFVARSRIRRPYPGSERYKRSMSNLLCWHNWDSFRLAGVTQPAASFTQELIILLPTHWIEKPSCGRVTATRQ